MVVSCFTVEMPPHDGHRGGGVGLMELSGIERVNPTTRCPAVVPSRFRVWILIAIASNRLLCGHVPEPARHALDAQGWPTVPPQASWHRPVEGLIHRLPHDRRHRSRRAVRQLFLREPHFHLRMEQKAIDVPRNRVWSWSPLGHTSKLIGAARTHLIR